MSSLLNIGAQALTSNQSALAYTGQNIANVNTEGYSRQRVNFETQESPLLGVSIQNVQRLTDQFLVQQVWKDQSALSSSEQQAQKVALLDKLMVSDSTNLSTAMDAYFESLQQAVDDPLFIANRQLFLTQADSLVSTFQNFEQRLADQQTGLTTEARAMVTSINSITQNIAQLNVKISTLNASGQNINTLIDERDELVKDLSSYVSVDVFSSDGGVTTNVLLANGEPLVGGSRAATLSVKDGNPDPLQIEIALSRGSVDADITALLGEGALGGMFSYRDNVLQPVRNEIGRLAIVFAESMNEQHRMGMDLNNSLGEDLFNTVTQGDVYASTENSRPIQTNLFFADTSQLTGSDYEIEFTSEDSYRIRRLSDGDITSGSFVAGTPIIHDGWSFQPSGTEYPTRGDRFLLQPTRNGARDLSLAITKPESLAFASPIRVSPDVSNTGNVEVTSVEVLDSSSSSPLRTKEFDSGFSIEFSLNAGAYEYVVLSDSTQSAAMTYTPGSAINVNGIFAVTFANLPNVGDSFEFTFNEDGVSDNSNAFAMANLQQTPTANGYSYQDAYGQLLAKVGSQANSIAITYASNQSVLASSQDALESIRGVNLDEEATKLIQYQQAYTASTRLITAYQDLFDSLITAVR